MPAEQIALSKGDHVALERIVERVEMRLEQFALHIEGLANDPRQALIAQAEFARELNALISLRTYRTRSILKRLVQSTETFTAPSRAEL